MEYGHGFEILTFIAVIVACGALVVLHTLPTGYNPIRDAVSDYGVGAYRFLFGVQVVSGALASLFLALSLIRLHPFTATQSVIALLITTISRLFIPFFPTDQGDSRIQTAQGVTHMALAILAFGGLVWASTGLWSTLAHYPSLQGAEGIVTILGRIMLWCVVLVLLALKLPVLKRFFGFFERLFLLTSYVWFFVIGIELIRLG